MANINTNGFEDLADDLERIASQITDESLKKRTLKKAAKPVVTEAKQIARRIFKTRTGALINSIGDTYNQKTGRQSIGWTNTGTPAGTPGKIGFYGFFHEVGYRHIIGSRTGKTTHQLRQSNARGPVIKNPHLRDVLDSKKEEILKLMIEQYEKAINN